MILSLPPRETGRLASDTDGPHAWEKTALKQKVGLDCEPTLEGYNLKKIGHPG